MTHPKGICLICKVAVNLIPNPDPPEIPESAGPGRGLSEEMYVTEEHMYLGRVTCDGSGLCPEAFEGDYGPAKEVLLMIEGQAK